jgi:hypothetical protein
VNGVSNVSSVAQPGDAALALFELYQHLRQFGVTRRARHQAHVRSLFENLLAFLLRHAAEHAEDLALARIALELLQPVKHLLLGLVADAARVVQHQPGGLRRLHLQVAS